MRRAFVFEGSSWRSKTNSPSLAQEYAQWVNDLLEKYPGANFDFHQSLGSFYSQNEESDWVEVITLVIVTE